MRGSPRADEARPSGTTSVTTAPGVAHDRPDIGDEEATAGTSATPRVLLIEDHELLAQSLSSVLAAEGIRAERAVASSPEEVLSVAGAGDFDVVLLDLDLGPLGSGLDLVRPLRALGARVVMLTASTDELTLGECIEAGAIGVVHKSASFDQLLSRVREAVTLGTLFGPGQRDQLMADLRQRRQARAERMRAFETLTRREQAVLAALMSGRTADRIARDEVVSITTVRSHIRSLLSKLGVHSQVAAVGLAHRAGWEPPVDG